MKRQAQKLSISRCAPRAAKGFSLIELMVAVVISVLMLLAILQLFIDVSRTNDEMAKTNILIENGRFSLQLMQADVQHAGFWGELDNDIDPPTAIPDPCVVAGWNAVYKTNLIGIPVQAFPDSTGLTGCGVTGVLANSDVLLVRHANTCVRGAVGCDGGADTGWHIQVSGCRNIGTEDPYVIEMVDPSNPLNLTLRTKTCSLDSPVLPADRAPQRKVISKLYYLAENGGVPTLMRVELVNGAYSTPQPLIEGVESFRVELGLDTEGKNGLPISASNPGDGSADEFQRCTALTPCVLDDLANVVAVKLYVLVRNTVVTRGYTDTKSYQLGSTTVAAANDGFKRHVFATTVRLTNPSGRREIP